MDKFKAYFNSLSHQEKVKFAEDCGTTIGYIRKMICLRGKLLFGPKLCRKFQSKSGGVIDPRHLRPDDWHEHWPELLDKNEAA